MLRSTPAAVQFGKLYPKRDPIEALLKDVEPGYDEFPLEKQAFEVTSHLKRLPQNGSLPLAPDFHGISPFPHRYVPAAAGVSKAEYNLSDTRFEAGLQKWLQSLGPIRDARFFVLPNDIVRYEIASGTQYRVGLWKQNWSGGKLSRFSPIEETVTATSEPLFRDITARAFHGIDSFKQQLLRGVPYWRPRLDIAAGLDVHGSNGIAVGDIDGDGWDEIYVCQSGGLPNRLYKNRRDGTFEDITEAAGVGVLDPTASALFVDFRNIGLQDLVVLRPNGPVLFLNQGENRFTRKAGAFRFHSFPEGSFTGMAAADYDRDGRVDLYLCTYAFFRSQGQYHYPVPFHDAQNGPPNFLLRNQLAADGSGVFEDVTEAAGLNQNNNRYSFAPAWCDYDGDGWPDLYVANDFGRKNLYKNEGGKFRDVAAEAGVADIGQGMSASWFDYDGDGRPDLYVSNMWTDAGQRIISQKDFDPAEAYRRHTKGNSLYRNRGDGTFEDTGAAEGVEMGRWAWSSDGIDFDNDGTPEIFITTGMLTNSSETDLESFLWRKVARASPATAKADSHYEDSWKALTRSVHEECSLAGRQANVFYVRRNRHYYDFSGVSGLDVAEDSRAFAVTDLDGDGNLDLLLKSRLGPQVRVFQNNSASGRNSMAIRLRGVKSNRDAIGARVEVDGQVKFLQAGSGYLSQHTKDLHFGLGDSKTARMVRILWPSGVEQEFQNLAAGSRHEIEEGANDVRSASFLAHREIPRSKLTGDNRPQFADTWLLEPVPLPERYPGPGILHLTEPLPAERLAWYTLFCRCLFDLRAELKLPIWFLVDEKSRAHKIYFAAPDPVDLQLMLDPDRVKIALPFAGQYCTPPERNYAGLGIAFLEAGFAAQALGYFERSSQDDYKNLFVIGQIHLEAERFEAARRYFERGLSLRPESPEGWNNLGGVEMGERNFRKALANYEKALTLNPEMISALANAGQAHVALGDLGVAEQMFRRVLELKPADPDAANQIGRLRVSQGRSAEARDWFQQAITAQRDHTDAINNLGILYMQMGQPNDAIAALSYGIDVAPEDELLYLNLGRVYVATANPDKARDLMTRLLARKPNSYAARRALEELKSR